MKGKDDIAVAQAGYMVPAEKRILTKHRIAQMQQCRIKHIPIGKPAFKTGRSSQCSYTYCMLSWYIMIKGICRNRLPVVFGSSLDCVC